MNRNKSFKIFYNYKVKTSLATWLTSKSQSHFYDQPFEFVVVYSYTFDKKYNGLVYFNNNNIIKQLRIGNDFSCTYALLKR